MIGGGDMSPDRLVPDYLRALIANDELVIRNPQNIYFVLNKIIDVEYEDI